MTDQERLQYLERENARLQRQLGVVGVSRLPHADMPDGDELATLHAMIQRAHPVTLTCSLAQFERSLLALCYARRQPELNASFYPTHWLDTSREWLRKQGYGTDISLRSFVAAAIASGVKYSPLTRYPFDLEFSLARGDVSKPSNAWRQVLESGRLPAPTPLMRRSIDVEPIDMVRSLSDDDDVPGPRSSDVRLLR